MSTAEHCSVQNVVLAVIKSQTWWIVTRQLESCGGTPWQYTVVVHCGGTLWWYTVVVHRGGTLWWYTVVVHRGGTLTVPVAYWRVQSKLHHKTQVHCHTSSDCGVLPTAPVAVQLRGSVDCAVSKVLDVLQALRCTLPHLLALRSHD